MNTNGNTYTVIYSIVLVVLVAAILAFVAMSLQDKQNENVKKETITKVLNAATQTDESLTIDETTDVLKLYSEKITEAFYVDGNGNIAGKMDMGKDDVTKIQVPSTSDLKKQNDILKKIDGTDDEAARAALLESLRLPVFIFDINGRAITVIPCYGAGLWGPIWGYIALAEDGKTIDGAIFDHKGETPGLGSKIAEPAFYIDRFKGKSLGSGETIFSIEKGKHEDNPHCVDAISGATITSRALGKGINLWTKYCMPYLEKAAAAVTDSCAARTCIPATAIEAADSTAAADTTVTGQINQMEE